MKIVLFEKEHFEGAFPVIKLFDRPGNEICIFTSPETHRRFLDLFLEDSNRYQWTVLPGKTKWSFFYSLCKNLKKAKPDILYINTISDNHLLYALVLRLLSIKRIIMTVHDINCLFESRPSFNFRKSVIHRGKKWLAKQIMEFNVVADTMIPYLRGKVKGKKIHNIPGSVFEGRTNPQTIDHKLRLVVPGSLDKRRRNYNQVFELAEIAARLNLSLDLILLGGYNDEYGKQIVERANQYHSANCKIIPYQTEVVDQAEFDRQMDNAHFVFIPSVINTRICGDIPEIYGITKSSGNIFDVIKHAKPFIVPSGLEIPANLQSSCFKYDNLEALAAFLAALISTPSDYDRWQELALENSSSYTIEKLRSRNPTLFSDPA